MPSAGWLLLALVASSLGVAWLALAMDEHWRQALGSEARKGRAASTGLRLLGVVALLLSLHFCLRADHASMAALVWLMSIGLAALSVALVLAWRPSALAFLAKWAAAGSTV